MIRRATIDDKPALKAMANRFIRFAPHAHLIDHTQSDIDSTVDMMLSHCQVFVLDVDGIAVGMLVAMMIGVWYAPSVKIAHEMAWWVDEEHRRGIGSIRLVRAYEQWARENGASAIAMCDLVIPGQEPVGATLVRLGYAMSERTYIKGAT